MADENMEEKEPYERTVYDVKAGEPKSKDEAPTPTMEEKNASPEIDPVVGDLNEKDELLDMATQNLHAQADDPEAKLRFYAKRQAGRTRLSGSDFDKDASTPESFENEGGAIESR